MSLSPINLPETNLPETNLPETNLPEIAQPSPTVLPLKILLAEDNAINQTIALKFLARLGYSATVVATGLEVLAALQQQPYDVVLMDVHMPELDGFATTQRIRQTWPSPEQPWIVAMTAHGRSGDRQRCLEMGMDAYLSKPFYPEDLQAILQQVRLKTQVQVDLQEPASQDLAGWSPGFEQSCHTPSPAEARTLVVLNPQRLLASISAMGDDLEDSLNLMRDTYLEEADRLLVILQQALSNRDLEALRFTAHTLKSSSMAMGAEALAETCQVLEHQASQARGSGWADLVTQIAQLYAQTTIALRQYQIAPAS